MSNFRSGDTVRCIDDVGFDHVQRNKEYRVISVTECGEYTTYTTIGGYVDHTFECASRRFVLVDSAYSTTEARNFLSNFKWVNNETANLIRQLADRIDALEVQLKSRECNE